MEIELVKQRLAAAERDYRETRVIRRKTTSFIPFPLR
jgi:hypothetical protein